MPTPPPNTNASPHEIDLHDRVAVVTGGGRGIGLAVTRALHARGMRVHICGRSREHLQQAAAADPEGITFTVCDLADDDAPDRLFAAVRERHEHLYLLVNNAGLGVYDTVEQTALADWDRMLRVNARAAFACAQAAFTHFRAHQTPARIVNIGSVVSHKGYVNQAGYTASKHALLGWTKVLAREGQAHGIRCAAVCPGGVATDMVAQARPDLDPQGLIQPVDVARAVVYLATEPETCCTDQLNLRRSGSTPFG